MPSRRPSSKRFVVRGVTVEALRAKLGTEFRVSMLDEKPLVVIVEAERDVLDPKAACLDIRSKVGGDVFVSPVLEDDRAGSAYPTGQIQVRFREVLSEPRQDAFAKASGMRFIECNKYQPAQCLFEPLDNGVYLPEVVTKLEASEGVRRAWEVTEGHYSRGS